MGQAGIRTKMDKSLVGYNLTSTIASSIEKTIADIIDREGKIDVLINNAGIGMISSFEEAPESNIRTVMETNFGGVLRLSQAVLPHMREQRSGKIINISSIAGLMGLPYRSIYSASKFAVEGSNRIASDRSG